VRQNAGNASDDKQQLQQLQLRKISGKAELTAKITTATTRGGGGVLFRRNSKDIAVTTRQATEGSISRSINGLQNALWLKVELPLAKHFIMANMEQRRRWKGQPRGSQRTAIIKGWTARHVPTLYKRGTDRTPIMRQKAERQCC